MLEKKGEMLFMSIFPFFCLWKILVFFIKMLTFLNNFVMKHLLLLLMIVLQSYIAISQNEISPLAREVYNKTTDYVRQKGWTAAIYDVEQAVGLLLTTEEHAVEAYPLGTG